MKIFIINGGQVFAHSGGAFNETLTGWTTDVLKEENIEYRITNINDTWDNDREVENFVWADRVIYHIPIWWFQLPNRVKLYIDEVFTAGHKKGIYISDGRSRVNPDINYGTGGQLRGTEYMLTTSWNAPATAFTLEGEFFEQHSPDEGAMFGFHKANKFVGMKQLEGYHFHDLEKNGTIERILGYEKDYKAFLKNSLKL